MENSNSSTLKNKRIFISPLDWGIGHASRCIQLIHELKENNTVLIGSTDSNSYLFKNYFPELQQLTVPSYNIRYSSNMPLWLKLVLQWPRIKHVVKQEQKLLKNIITQNKIDLVISDNRFGLYSETIPSIFITHQLSIQTPFFSSLINSVNRNYIHRFTEVWVPDFYDKEKRLSGNLSDASKIKIPVNYIGPLSALKNAQIKNETEKIDYLIVLSGIEPLRSDLENVLLEKFDQSTANVVMVRGSDKALRRKSNSVKCLNFSYGEELRSLIVNSETVICRSGYSTLMDMNYLNKKNLILIPTPGQFEQLYLAELWKKKFGAKVYSMKQLKEEFKTH